MLFRYERFVKFPEPKLEQRCWDVGVCDTRGNFPSVQFDFLRVHFVDIPGDPEMNRKKDEKKREIECLVFFKAKYRK